MIDNELSFIDEEVLYFYKRLNYLFARAFLANDRSNTFKLIYLRDVLATDVAGCIL